jgi:hypothetical protein
VSKETELPGVSSAGTAWPVRDDLGTLIHLVIIDPPGATRPIARTSNPLFTRVRGIGILRSSQVRNSRKFAKKVVINTAIE